MDTELRFHVVRVWNLPVEAVGICSAGLNRVMKIRVAHGNMGLS
jgi:hypothetical protein